MIGLEPQAPARCACGDCMTCELRVFRERAHLRRVERRHGVSVAELRRRAVDVALDRLARRAA
jgi:hypothetical protein